MLTLHDDKSLNKLPNGIQFPSLKTFWKGNGLHMLLTVGGHNS